MWYLIADANGLSNANSLIAGQVLTIPNKITNIHNNSCTYRVYNSVEAQGNLLPTIPDAPPPPPPPARKKKKGGCGGFGGLIVAAITIAAVVITQQYQLLPQAITALGPVATAAATAAVGNIAGQVAGNALGVQSGFDFKSFGTAVLTAGVTEGLIGGTVLANGTTTAGLFGDGIQSALGSTLGNFGAVAARAMINNVVGQGVGNLTGLQRGFSWSSVAAAGVGAAAGYAMGKSLGVTLADSKGDISKTASFFTAASQGATASAVSQLTQIALDGKGKLNWATVAVSGFGAGVGALAGYYDPKNGARADKTASNPYNPFNTLASAYEIDIAPIIVRPPTAAEIALENAKGMATETADRLMYINNIVDRDRLITGASIGLSAKSNKIALPVGDVRYTPITNGSWTGERGNSGWKSSNQSVIEITNGKPVQFKNNYPNFTPWAKDSFNIKGLTGNTKADFKLVYQAMMKKNGFANELQAKEWLNANGLVPHHHQNGLTMQLVPSALHNAAEKGVNHPGGASVLRKWDYSKGTPQQVNTANKFAVGARFVGGAGMVYGAYTDGASLYTQYQQSQAVGNYSNTVSETARILGGWSAAWIAGESGALVGASWGSALGPVGTVIGGIAGGVIGGAIGYAGGSYAAPRLLNDARYMYGNVFNN